MGTPNLYDLNLSFEVNDEVSDLSRTKFGIREIASEVAEQAPDRVKLLFKVNGKNILLRGGGWTPDMMLRETPERLADEFRYVRDLGLNTVRLEGKLETDDFFEMADQQGILVMAGWCCCDFWEHWGSWTDEDFVIAKASLRDQMYRMRGHPSMLMWLNGSDNAPPPDVEEMYLKIESELRWPNPVVSSATAKTSSVTGESGVKMSGPYEYVAPSYWEGDPYFRNDQNICNPCGCGGAYGFNTETSMGPAVPPIESIERMIPKEHLWTASGSLDEYWSFHAGGGKFKNVQVFSDALNARYGKAASAEDFSYKSQLMTYEGVRAMYEAYRRNKYTSTGVVQWMLNNAWPSMIWHLYDWYLRPGGSYFGAKKANEPLHIQYSYDDASVVVVNSFYRAYPGMKARAWVYNIDMSEKFAKDAALDVAEDSSTRVFTIPALDGLSSTYFVRLALEDASGKTVSTNFYWLSTKPDDLDWDQSTWFYTPQKSYADYTALTGLPPVELKYSAESEVKGDDGVTRVTVENPSGNLAFAVHLMVKTVKHDEEDGTVAATYKAAYGGKRAPAVRVEGWNVK